MARPSPVPSCLVEKNGSNRRLVTPGEKPGTWSIVAHRQLYLVIGGRGGADDDPRRAAWDTRGQCIQAVAEEIEDHLLNLAVIDDDLRQLRGQLERQLHAMHVRIDLQQVQ